MQPYTDTLNMLLEGTGTLNVQRADSNETASATAMGGRLCTLVIQVSSNVCGSTG